MQHLALYDGDTGAAATAHDITAFQPPFAGVTPQ
jgi:hypothetical protein